MDSKGGNAPLTLLGGLIMSCGDPLKHGIFKTNEILKPLTSNSQKVPSKGQNMRDLISIQESDFHELDYESECLQFGDCSPLN